MTGQSVLPDPKPFKSLPKYIFFAENLQLVSAGQERQFVALPAAVGLRVLLKYWRAPEEETVVGMWAGCEDFGGGEQSIHKRRSMSWHDLVRRDGADVDSLRQLPLDLLDLPTYWES